MAQHRTGALAVIVLTALVAGCSSTDQQTRAIGSPGATPTPASIPASPDGEGHGGASPDEPVPDTARLGGPQDLVTVLPAAAAAELAVATSAVLFDSAPVAVLAPSDDAAAQSRAARAAVALGMPLLLSAPDAPASPGSTPGGRSEEPADPTEGARSEIERLQAGTVLTFGAVPEGWSGVDVVAAPDGDEDLARVLDVPTADTPDAPDGQEGVDPVLAATVALTPGELSPSTGPEAAGDPSDGVTGASGADDQLPPTAPGTTPDVVRVLSTGAPDQLAAVATARAAGAEVLLVPGGDPRATGATVQAFVATEEGNEPDRTVALGPAFGDATVLQERMATAATGVELPGGGQLVLPGKTYIALYGSPITASLGVLGEQGPEATVQRAQEHASWYTDLTPTTVVPTLEIIATVASGQAGSDGNYSNEWPVEALRPLVDLARDNGQYVVLDLQPGRTDFLTQAQLYEELLLEPHVGLALDPEWRLAPDQVHLRQIGQVGVEEVDAVVGWLADLTRDNQLPQKMLVLHKFQVRMIPGSDDVDQSRSELAVLVHVDGQGSQPAKQETWQVLRRNSPSISWWGWKNFYDEDTPMLTPEQTMQVEPAPHFVSYQ